MVCNMGIAEFLDTPDSARRLQEMQLTQPSMHKHISLHIPSTTQAGKRTVMMHMNMLMLTHYYCTNIGDVQVRL